MTGTYLFFDIESHNVGRQWGMTPRDYFRLGQYAWDNGEVILTTDYDEMIQVIRQAGYVVGHNVHAFDLSVLFGTDSLEPLHMAQQRKVIDTLTMATLLTPAPLGYRSATGAWMKAEEPAQVMKYFGLENLAYQFGLEGKFGSLQDLAKKYNPPKTLVRDLDYGLIPLDDPDFLEYARQDVIAVRDLFHYLLTRQQKDPYDSDYMWREQELHAVMAQITRNGIRPNVELAQSRMDEQNAVVAETMRKLQEEFGLPTTGKAPWKSNAGKEAILNALKSFGITPDHPDWERTEKGAPSFGGDVMLAVTAGSPAEEFGKNLALLQGMRSMPNLLLSSVTGDGRLHPDMTAFQKSGRFSVTNPSILIWNRDHKDLFLADEGCYTVELDISSADARAVAAMSGDLEFAKRFEIDEKGKAVHDGHNLSGEVFFGYEIYHGECEDKSKCGKNCRPLLRPAAKAAGLSLGYNVGPVKLAILLNKDAKKFGIKIEFWASETTYWKYRKLQEETGQSVLSEKEWLESIRQPGKIHTRELIYNYHENYMLVKRWKDQVVQEGDRDGFVTNAWGRKMPIDYAGAGWDAPEGKRSRSYTMSPALYGQSTTREIMSDFLIKMCRAGEKWARCLRGVIHDAVVVDLPQETIEEDSEFVRSLLETWFDPNSRVGMRIHFPAEKGPTNGLDWREGSH